MEQWGTRVEQVMHDSDINDIRISKDDPHINQISIRIHEGNKTYDINHLGSEMKDNLRSSIVHIAVL